MGKDMKENIFRRGAKFRAGNSGGGGGVGKGKREEKRKKESFNAETIKRLSPRSKCYCFIHSGASRIQNTFQCSMAPTL